MKRASRGAALAAVFISVLLPFPQAGGVHLVSNQPIGTDNQNNAPVQYAPKMASKLGLSQPQNREPEYLTNESLANAIRQLMESHKRQTTFLERLAALAPKYKPEGLQPKKTSKASTSKSPPRNSDSSVIMRPSKKTPENLPEKDLPTEVDVNRNKTEENPHVVDNSECPKNHPQSTLYHRSYVRPSQHVYVPSDSRLPTHMAAGHHNPQVQVLYPKFSSTVPLGQNPHLLQNRYSNSVAPSNQDSVSPHNNVVGAAPHTPSPHTFENQFSHNFAVSSSPSQNPLTPQNPHNNVVGVAPHIQNPRAPQSQYPYNVVVTSPSQNSLKSQNPHNNVVGVAPHIQNPRPLQSNVVANSPSQSPLNPQNPHNNAPHIQNPHVLQSPHSSNDNVPFYIPTTPVPNVVGTTNQNKPQNPHPGFAAVAQGQNPHILQARSHPGPVSEALPSQDSRMPQLIPSNYVTSTPLRSRNPFIPHQGLLLHQIAPQNPNSPPPLSGPYPQTLYLGNSQPGSVGQLLASHSNGGFPVNPHQAERNAQQYNYLSRRRPPGL